MSRFQLENIDALIVGGGPAGLTAANVTLLMLDGKGGSEKLCRDLSDAAIRLPAAHVTAFARRGEQMVAVMSDGRAQTFDVIYPVKGYEVRSELGKKLRARHTNIRCLEVDAHQQTSVRDFTRWEMWFRICTRLRSEPPRSPGRHIQKTLPRNFC